MRMDAPGRRGRFVTYVAKSSDDACAVGAYHGIVSLIEFFLSPLCQRSVFIRKNATIAEGLVRLKVRICDVSDLVVLGAVSPPSGLPFIAPAP